MKDVEETLSPQAKVPSETPQSPLLEVRVKEEPESVAV